MGKAKEIICLVIILLITGIFLYGNVIAKKGGILDDCLLDHENYYFKTDQKVKTYCNEGLETGDSIAATITFPEGLNKGSLKYIKWLTDKLKAHFPECGLLSLSTASYYHDTGIELLSKPYISDDLLQKINQNPAWDIEAWKNHIKKDDDVYGVLIGKNFDYAQIIIFLPVGYDEIELRDRIAEIFEERDVGWWEWFIKSDIYPTKKFENVTLAGWSIARSLMDSALLSDILKLSTIGLFIVTLAFYFSLISIPQSLIASSIILLDFIWIRGAIGIMQLYGIGIYERVYLTLVYTASIVAGISFAERKFNAYNEARKQYPDLSRREVWEKTNSAVNGRIGIVAFIAILNFITLYQIGIRGIMEVGILSSLGILFLLIFVYFYIPAIHTLVGGEVKKTATNRLEKIAHLWHIALHKIVSFCFRILTKFSFQKTRNIALGVVIVCVLGALSLLVTDYLKVIDNFKFIEVKTKPLEYLPDTIVWRASKILNKPGYYGFDRLSYLVLPKDKSNIMENPAFITTAFQFQKEIGRLSGTRTSKSILNTVKKISNETFHKDFPSDPQQMYDIFQTIEWDMGEQLKKQLWFDKGLIVFASLAADDSNQLSDYSDRVVQLSKKFPTLEVLPFGKLHLYPQADRYIREGKPLNALSSFWIVILACALWIIFNNRRYKTKGANVYLSGWRTGFCMSFPFIFATSIIIFVMTILRVSLDQATACILALAINAAIDFGLYLVADYQSALLKDESKLKALEYALLDKGKIIVVDILLNILCFIPLISSQFIPIERLGWIMVVMLLTCAIGSLIILPAFLPWCIKKSAN